MELAFGFFYEPSYDGATQCPLLTMYFRHHGMSCCPAAGHAVKHVPTHLDGRHQHMNLVSPEYSS